MQQAALSGHYWLTDGLDISERSHILPRQF
jgi:hypothetical protein